MDCDFDQMDLVQVQLAAKYMTGEEATWGEGDWNGAPGGSVEDKIPPPGDGQFNQLDIVAALDAATGHIRWRQTYSLDRPEPALSFGVQANVLLKNDTLFVNGGAPVGVVALDADTGENARVAAKLEAGMEMFLEPDGRPSCRGPELYCDVPARTTIFKRHQGRVYFPLSDRFVALVDGRLFCARDMKSLDQIVDLMNKDPQTGGRLTTTPRNVMDVPLNESILWAGKSADLRGIAVGTDGIVTISSNQVEGISPEGRPLWTANLSAAPVRWGVALVNNSCLVTLADGHVVCLGQD
jgi:outer membrane protein assembly factor BamB